MRGRVALYARESGSLCAGEWLSMHGRVALYARESGSLCAGEWLSMRGSLSMYSSILTHSYILTYSVSYSQSYILI